MRDVMLFTVPGYSRPLDWLLLQISVGSHPLSTHIRQFLYRQLEPNPMHIEMEAPLTSVQKFIL